MLSIATNNTTQLTIKAACHFVSSLLIILLLTACAHGPQTQQLLHDTTLRPTALINDVPFISQQKYQCGPAALTMMLTYRGVQTNTEQLKSQVFLPDRNGSLQIEILATTRRYQRIPYIINPHLKALFQEVAAGNPVLVLQNLGLQWIPQWHYAVVIGYDLDKMTTTLHSGSNAKYQTNMTTFERTWKRAGMWGLVITGPNRIPSSADPVRYIKAVESLQGQDMVNMRIRHQAYLTATQKWPAELIPRLALGNSYYQLGDLAAAEKSFRFATELQPDSVLALNNLAQTLLDIKQYDDALAIIRHAASLGGPFASTVQQTKLAIEKQLNRNQ